MAVINRRLVRSLHEVEFEVCRSQPMSRYVGGQNNILRILTYRGGLLIGEGRKKYENFHFFRIELNASY